MLNISETKDVWSDITKKPYIEMEVEVGLVPNSTAPRTAELYFEADRWKPQIDKIERGDWLVADGTVHNIHKFSMSVANAEIISISGSDVNKQ